MMTFKATLNYAFKTHPSETKTTELTVTLNDPASLNNLIIHTLLYKLGTFSTPLSQSKDPLPLDQLSTLEITNVTRIT